jgi:hypothetical protein
MDAGACGTDSAYGANRAGPRLRTSGTGTFDRVPPEAAREEPS